MRNKNAEILLKYGKSKHSFKKNINQNNKKHENKLTTNIDYNNKQGNKKYHNVRKLENFFHLFLTTHVTIRKLFDHFI